MNKKRRFFLSCSALAILCLGSGICNKFENSANVSVNADDEFETLFEVEYTTGTAELSSYDYSKLAIGSYLRIYITCFDPTNGANMSIKYVDNNMFQNDFGEYIPSDFGQGTTEMIYYDYYFTESDFGVLTDPSFQYLVVQSGGAFIYKVQIYCKEFHNIAKIGDTEYASLTDAVNNVTEGQEIKLLVDMENYESIYVIRNISFTVDKGSYYYDALIYAGSGYHRILNQSGAIDSYEFSNLTVSGEGRNDCSRKY